MTMMRTRTKVIMMAVMVMMTRKRGGRDDCCGGDNDGGDEDDHDGEELDILYKANCLYRIVPQPPKPTLAVDEAGLSGPPLASDGSAPPRIPRLRA
eukprot:9157953-Pyramimonas_sp.AAC.1